MKIPFYVKLVLAITTLAVGATAISVITFYQHSRTLLLDQMGNRLKDIGRTATYLFGEEERQAIKRLNARVDKNAIDTKLVTGDIKPGEYRRSLPEKTETELMQSKDFQHLVTVLRKIKKSTGEKSPVYDRNFVYSPDDKTTLKYVSILTTIDDSKERQLLRFLADADYDDAKFPCPIGNLIFGDSDAVRLAFGGEVLADQDFRYEDSQSLLSAGIPVYVENGQVLAVLKLYYDAAGEANKVQNLKNLCITIVVVSFFVSLIVAALLTKILNRPIRTLREGAEKVKSRDFTTKIVVNTRDEFGLLANAFNTMVEEIGVYAKGLEDHNAAYRRFVPKAFLDNLGHESILKIQLGDQVQRQMTILFADIRSFTAISESMSPRDNFDFINQYLKAVSPVIRSHGGFIDKYIGDGIMALFPDKPEDAVQAGLAMQKILVQFNKEGNEIGRPHVNIGIGIHTGMLMLGTIGEEQRMEGTVISDAVNLCARIEGITKEFGAKIIVSEKVHNTLNLNPKYHTRFLGAVSVKGKKKVTNIFEVIDIESELVEQQKIITKTEFESGVRHYEKGNYSKAYRQFKAVYAINRQDKAVRLFLDKCKSAAAKDVREAAASKSTEIFEMKT